MILKKEVKRQSKRQTLFNGMTLIMSAALIWQAFETRKNIIKLNQDLNVTSEKLYETVHGLTDLYKELDKDMETMFITQGHEVGLIQDLIKDINKLSTGEAGVKPPQGKRGGGNRKNKTDEQGKIIEIEQNK